MHIEWRLPPTLMRPVIAAGAVAVAAVALLWWLSAPVHLTPVPTRALAPVPQQSAAVVVVDVVGAVRRPGVLRLPSDARVIDAVTAAGGLLPGRSPVVNLARPLVDGEQIVIGVGNGAGAVAVTSSTSGGRLNLNSADAAALDGLPGIGPVLAQRIVEYRRNHGPFAHTRDLLDVPGIGDAKFANLSDAVSAP